MCFSKPCHSTRLLTTKPTHNNLNQTWVTTRFTAAPKPPHEAFSTISITIISTPPFIHPQQLLREKREMFWMHFFSVTPLPAKRMTPLSTDMLCDLIPTRYHPEDVGISPHYHNIILKRCIRHIPTTYKLLLSSTPHFSFHIPSIAPTSCAHFVEPHQDVWGGKEQHELGVVKVAMIFFWWCLRSIILGWKFCDLSLFFLNNRLITTKKERMASCWPHKNNKKPHEMALYWCTFGVWTLWLCFSWFLVSEMVTTRTNRVGCINHCSNTTPTIQYFSKGIFQEIQRWAASRKWVDILSKCLCNDHTALGRMWYRWYPWKYIEWEECICWMGGYM